MSKKSQKIVAELIAIDPELVAHEKELTKMIDKIIAVKPSVDLDRTLAMQIREEILARSKTSKKFNFFKMQKTFQSIGVAALAVIVALPAGYFVGSGQSAENGGRSFAPPAKAKIELVEVQKNAFGELKNAKSQPKKSEALRMNLQTTAAISPEIAAADVAADESAEMVAEDFAMIEPDSLSKRISTPDYLDDYVFKKYVYNFDGVLPALESQQKVLKRVPEFDFAVGQILNNLNLPLFDASKLKKTDLEGFSVTEDRKYGYSIYVNPKEGEISISKNWSKWPDPHADCRDEKCFENLELKPADVPADKKIISIVQDFVKEYGIDTSIYGQPEVRKNWENNFFRSELDEVWIPFEIEVIFPLLIEGQVIDSGWGNKIGLSVSVDVREKKVSGVHGLRTQRYESSSYESGSVDELKKYISRGGRYGWIPEDEKIEEVSVTLGQPQKIWMHSHDWSEDAGGQDLIVPALKFPVTSVDEGADEWFAAENKNLIVPLVKKLLTEEDRDFFIEPLFLEEGDVEIEIFED